MLLPYLTCRRGRAVEYRVEDIVRIRVGGGPSGRFDVRGYRRADLYFVFRVIFFVGGGGGSRRHRRFAGGENCTREDEGGRIAVCIDVERSCDG